MYLKMHYLILEILLILIGLTAFLFIVVCAINTILTFLYNVVSELNDIDS